MPSERPDGALSGLLYEYGRRLSAATNHAVIEGHSEVNGLAVLESYDRNLHPQIHGRRPEDLANSDLAESIGFAIGACLSVLRYGPVRLAEKVRGWWPW